MGIEKKCTKYQFSRDTIRSRTSPKEYYTEIQKYVSMGCYDCNGFDAECDNYSYKESGEFIG